MPGHRSRRLRKKLRIGEFQEFGFDVSFQLRASLTEVETEQFWDAFLLEAIEPNGLAFGGGTEGFVTAWGRGSATDTHRERVRAWLSSRPEIESVSVGALIDAWHQRHDEHVI